jgi:hypothetical protein
MRTKTLTILIAHDFRPWKSNLLVLKRMIKSINTYISCSIDTEIVIALDGLRPEFQKPSNIKSRTRFIRKIDNYMPNNCRIEESPEWGHLSGNIVHAVSKIQSDYLLVTQADLPFIKTVDLDKVLLASSKLPNIRFNRRVNSVAGWDTQLEPVYVAGGTFLKTPNWSDCNHLSPTSHYKEEIIPRIKNYVGFPENLLHPINKDNHLGTYIFGGLGEGAYVAHYGLFDRFASPFYSRIPSPGVTFIFASVRYVAYKLRQFLKLVDKDRGLGESPIR